MRGTKIFLTGSAEKMQNNKMPKAVKFLFLGALCLALLADVVFIIWATQSNFLIVLPAVLSAAYLSYVTAYWTIFASDRPKI